ncbi:hypothetical protein bcere0023_54990 [Bacillus cereus Rock4-2]|nr:hypothetical protein bcere0023_54990 [Bacillus cereus Rock4-2]
MVFIWKKQMENVIMQHKKETVKYILENNKPVAQLIRETGLIVNPLYS